MSNRGGGEAPATTLRYYRSADAAITTSDTQVGTDAVATLAAGGSSHGSASLNAPAMPDTYYYGACVEAVPEETNTANNCSAAVALTVREPPRRPDLVVTAMLGDALLKPGERFTLGATVGNRGGADAPPPTVRYHRSADATITTTDTQVGTDAVDGLAASGTSAESIALTAPATSGTYYYGACVDAVQGESDTTNNCSAAVEVEVSEPTAPDLEVGTPTVDDASPETEESFTLSATVTNAGDGAAAATTLRYHRSADAAITTTDTQVGTDAVDELAASGTSAESIALTAPAMAGTYYYGACVDAVSNESNTENNCSAATQLTVSWPPLLRVTTWLCTMLHSTQKPTEAPKAGEDITFTVTIRNKGNVASTERVVTYYRRRGATNACGSTNPTIAVNVGEDRIDTLSAGAEREYTVTFTAPNYLTPFTFSANVESDADDLNGGNDRFCKNTILSE